MGNRFTEPDEGLEPRPDLEPREGEDDEIFALVEMAMTEIRKATDSLASGNLTVKAWHEQMVDILCAYHLAGWYISNEDDPDDEQMGILANAVADQLDYLAGFRDELKDEADDTLSMAYRNRAEMYGRAVKISYWIGVTGGIELPFYPCERCICHTNCGCGWQIEAVEGGWDATWRLGATDHCDTCKERAKLKPLRIRDGQYDRKQVTNGMYA